MKYFDYDQNSPDSYYYEKFDSLIDDWESEIVEFNEAKNNYLKTESDLVQARYEYLYQTALLDFYRGRDLNF